MNRDSVRKLYERLESLVERLPGGVQKPILSELVPLRELFLEQRPARLLVLGDAESVTLPEALKILCGGAEIATGESHAGWRTYQVTDRGSVQVLDARASTPDDVVTLALGHLPPDAVLFLHAGASDDNAAAFDLAAARVIAADGEGRLPLVALSFGADAEAAIARLGARLNARREFAQRPLHIFATASAEAAAEVLCAALPNCAKLELARMTAARAAQAAIAGSLLKSFTAVCGVIGVQPIPLADMPILTTLQSLLVGMIVYVSGRRASARLIAEFAAALGVSVGAGFAFREGARALLKVFPIWGNAISGIVAGAGTYAVGRAAIAYFIEDLPLQETRRLFRRLQPGLESFRGKALPRLGGKKGGPDS